MVKQKTTLTGDDSPRFNPDGSPRLSEIDERIQDMEGRGWTLDFKSEPIETEKKLFQHKTGKTFGAQSRYVGTESRVKVRAVMVREYEGTIGGRRHGRQTSRSAI